MKKNTIKKFITNIIYKKIENLIFCNINFSIKLLILIK